MTGFEAAIRQLAGNSGSAGLYCFEQLKKTCFSDIIIQITLSLQVKTMVNCNWCDLSEEDKRFQVYESTLWSVFLSDEQDYIGRCILVLKRHCGSLSELTADEWKELRVLICKVETCLKTVLGAALCNWSCLMNSFYKAPDPDPHLHIHVRPRYDKPVLLNGNTYTDDEFGHHYAKNKSGAIPPEDKEKLFTLLNEWLNR